MKRLWFIEGCDGVGKTTVVRELCNLSGHKISGVVDRGPMSRMVWAAADNDFATVNEWRAWFASVHLSVGVILLSAKWPRVQTILNDEASHPDFEGVTWRDETWSAMALCYVHYMLEIGSLGVPCYAVNAENPIEVVLAECAIVMGYPSNVFDVPAINPVGQRDKHRPSQN